MKIRILWPGKTRSEPLRDLERSYWVKVNLMQRCEIIETKEARGIPEKNAPRILEIETEGMDKYIKDDYVICLDGKGKQLSSKELAGFLSKLASGSQKIVTFVVGGFLGLGAGLLERADFTLSLSKMTFSHELSRVMLLEQLYRSLSIVNGRNYAK